MKRSTFEFTNEQITKSIRSKFSNQLTVGVSVINSGESLQIHPLGLEGFCEMSVVMPSQDVGLFVEAIDDVTRYVTELLEVSQEIGYFLGTSLYTSGDRMVDIENTTSWAKEFCRANFGRNWEQSDTDWESAVADFVRAKITDLRQGDGSIFTY